MKPNAKDQQALGHHSGTNKTVAAAVDSSGNRYQSAQPVQNLTLLLTIPQRKIIWFCFLLFCCYATLVFTSLATVGMLRGV